VSNTPSRIAIIIFASACAASAHGQDTIIEWNQELLESIRVSNTAPPAAARQMAMVHLAAYEAVNSIDRSYRPYRSYYDCPSGTSKEAAAAVAARNVLAGMYPARTAQFDARLAAQLGVLPAGLSKDDGITLGGQASARIMSMRSADGSGGAAPAVADGTLPGQWRRTVPAFANPALPHWGGVAPFAVTSATQFDPGPAPELSSAAYLSGYNEVRELGSATSGTRTAYQTDTAFLWRAGGDTVTPPGQWNHIAQQIAVSRGQSIDENARMFALLGMAVADAGVTSWHAKYEDMLWRPITGIQLGDVDGVDGTVGDSAWQPLFATPNHPSFTSGHSTFSSAAAAVLADFVGSDLVTFTVSGDGRTREYHRLSDAMEDAGMSRIYGGIHWQMDNVAGLASGSAVGSWVYGNSLTVPGPGAAALLLAGLAINRRRRV